VQNTAGECWLELADFELDSLPLCGSCTLAVSVGTVAAAAPEWRKKFVQNKVGKCWLNLADFELGLPTAVRKLRK